MSKEPLRLGYPDEPKIDESKLQPITQVEDLQPHVGKYIYWRERGDDKWAQAKLIWTGNSEDRFFDEIIPQRFLRDKLFKDPTLTAVADIRTKLQSVDPSIANVSVTDKLEELASYQLQAGLTPEPLLAVKHDRNQYPHGGEKALGDHFALKLLDDDKSGNIREIEMTIALTPETLKKYELSVEK